MTTGQFIDFTLIFEQNGNGGLDNRQQAEAIVAEARKRLDAGAPVVAITYSANQDQTDALIAAYAISQYSANITGLNQAQVMHALEDLLRKTENADLRLRMRIAPITTIPNSGTDAELIATADIARIRGQLVAGWTILGWRNQDTVNDAKHPYAVGGGVAGKLPAAVETVIQSGLKALATNFPPQGDDAA